MNFVRKTVFTCILCFLLFILNSCKGIDFYLDGKAIDKIRSLENEILDLENQIDEWEERYQYIESEDEVVYVKMMNASEQARSSNILIDTILVKDRWLLSNTSYKQGSGFVFKKDESYYYALTNYHVISLEGYDKAEYHITLNNGETILGDLVAYGDNNLDLAVIKFPILDNYVALTTIDFDTEYAVGDCILVIGNPGGVQNVVTPAILEEYPSYINNLDYPVLEFSYTMDAKGNSGSAVINLDGDLIGVFTWGSDKEKYAIPLSQVINFLKSCNLYEE